MDTRRRGFSTVPTERMASDLPYPLLISTALRESSVGRVAGVVAGVELGAVGRRSPVGRLVIVYRHGCDFWCLGAYSGGPGPPSARSGA